MINYRAEDFADCYRIGTNRWFERTTVDCVVAVDEYQVRYISSILPADCPFYTRPPWSEIYHLPAPAGAVRNEISGSLAIRVAAELGFEEIHLLGFDAYFAGSTAKWVEPERARSRTVVPEFWHTVVTAAVLAAPGTVHIHTTPTQFLKELNMCNGDDQA